MIKRFQIEEIIVQDSEGITFRALDTESDAMVAVRRFFPFGADGGGLHVEEQTAYNIAVGRLSGLSHPALRAVVTGGCDPIDGIPYIATEWIEGEHLNTIIAQGPLSVEDAAGLIIVALEVSELLSHVLAEEAVWVETDPRTIIVGNEASGRGLTFWISPLKWLGGDERARGFDAIIDLAEEVMDWKGRIVSDQAGRGLGGWIKWLRAAAATVTIHEVRQMLAASIGADPPAPANHLAINAITNPVSPPVKGKGSSSKTPWLIGIGLFLVTAGLAGCWWVSQSKDTASIINAAPARPMSATEAINKRAAELMAQANAGAPPPAQAKPTATGVIRWDQREILASFNNVILTIEGTVRMTSKSDKAKTIYLLFADKSDKTAVRVRLRTKKQAPDVVSKSLDAFVGKKIQATGTFMRQTGIGNSQPDLIIQSISSIKIIE